MHMTSLGRLGPPPQAEGDVFHVSVQQLDAAIKESSFDLRAAVTPNRATYARAKSAKSCPMLIDSRGRILKPNLVEGEPGETLPRHFRYTLPRHFLDPSSSRTSSRGRQARSSGARQLSLSPHTHLVNRSHTRLSSTGALVGAAISPGVASGRVRVCTCSTDPIAPGEARPCVRCERSGLSSCGESRGPSRRCSSPSSPTRRGRRCLRAPRPSSSRLAARCSTARCARASTASRDLGRAEDRSPGRVPNTSPDDTPPLQASPPSAGST